MRLALALAASLWISIALPHAGLAQGAGPPEDQPAADDQSDAAAPQDGSGVAFFPKRELIVGTKEAPPFAMKDASGAWTGLSVELWRHMADKLGLRYRLVEEPTVQGLIDSTARGDYDLSVAAITITAERERLVDFSQPFYATGLGIAVSTRPVTVWREVARTMASSGFLIAIGTLIGLALLVGVLVWLFERRHNEDFGGSPVRGLGAS